MRDNPDGRRPTYSLWIVVGLFLLLGLVGLWAVIFLGVGESVDTEVLPPATPAPTTSSPEEPTTPTMPDGSPAPEGVVAVESGLAGVDYSFALPADFAGPTTTGVVAPVLLDVGAEGTMLTVTFACAGGAGSLPAAVRVSEDPLEVRVLAVAVVPDGAPPCVEGDVIGTLTVPLSEPVGERRLEVERPGEVMDLPRR